MSSQLLKVNQMLICAFKKNLVCCSCSYPALLQLFCLLAQSGVCLSPLLVQISLAHKNREGKVLVNTEQTVLSLRCNKYIYINPLTHVSQCNSMITAYCYRLKINL